MQNNQPRTPFFLFAFLMATAIGSHAQPGPRYGDLLVSGYSLAPPLSAVYAVDPNTNRLTTLHTTTTGEIGQWVGMMDDNRHIGLLSYNQRLLTGRLYGITPGGASTLLGSIRTAGAVNDPTNAVWDPEGRLLIAAGNSLYRYDPAAPGPILTVFSFPQSPSARPFLQGVAVGPGRTGNFHDNYFALNALPETGSPTLTAPFVYRFDPKARKFSTLVSDRALLTGTSLSYRYGVPKPNRKQLLVTRGRAGSGTLDLLGVDFLTGALSTLARFTTLFPAAHKTTKRNTAWVVGPTTSVPTTNLALEIDLATGALKRTVTIKGPAGFRATGVDEFGTNLLHLTGRAFREDAPLVFSLQTNDPTLAGKNYVLGLAFEPSPPTPIMVGSQMVQIELAPDPLLMTSLFNPGVLVLTTSWGVLDGLGNASASLTLNSSIKTNGLTIYAAWVIYDKSSVLRVSETELFVLP